MFHDILVTQNLGHHIWDSDTKLLRLFTVDYFWWWIPTTSNNTVSREFLQKKVHSRQWDLLLWVIYTQSYTIRLKFNQNFKKGMFGLVCIWISVFLICKHFWYLHENIKFLCQTRCWLAIQPGQYVMKSILVPFQMWWVY